MCGRAAIAAGANRAGIVAGVKVETAGYYRRLILALWQENSIQADQQTLFGDFSKVDVDRGALGDGRGSGDILGDLKDKAVGRGTEIR